MSESEVNAISQELERLGCKEVAVSGVTTSDELVLLQCDEEKSLLPAGVVLDLLKGLEVPEDAPPDRFVWYMVDKELAMLNQNP